MATVNLFARRSMATTRTASRAMRNANFSGMKMPGGMPTVDPKQINTGAIAALACGAAGLYVANQTVLFTDAGFIYVIQNNLSGSLSIKSEPGIHFRVPFFSNVTIYKQILTASFEAEKNTDSTIRVRFADTYLGNIPASFRFKLPLDPDRMMKLHKDFRSESNLSSTLLARNARDVTVVTATQYTGEEFFQGGLNQFKNQLHDQLTGGIYETERKQVQIEATELAPVSSSQADSRSLQTTKQLVWKTVPILDDRGKEKRLENPLAQCE